MPRRNASGRRWGRATPPQRASQGLGAEAPIGFGHVTARIHQLSSFAGSQSSAAHCGGHGAGDGGAGGTVRRCEAALMAFATAAAPGAALGVSAVSAHASSWKRPSIDGDSR